MKFNQKLKEFYQQVGILQNEADGSHRRSYYAAGEKKLEKCIINSFDSAFNIQRRWRISRTINLD